MIIDGLHIPVTRQWINDVLEKRIGEMHLKIEDLFIITRVLKEDLEGDSLLETKYGKIRIFFRSDLPDTKLALICHKSKFDYPKKNIRLSLNIVGGGGVVTSCEVKEEYKLKKEEKEGKGKERGEYVN